MMTQNENMRTTGKIALGVCEQVENGEEVLWDDIEAGQTKEWEEREKTAQSKE